MHNISGVYMQARPMTQEVFSPPQLLNADHVKHTVLPDFDFLIVLLVKFGRLDLL